MSPAPDPVGGAAPGPAARARSVFLPREHGSWSLALEPLALGLAVAPSLAGAGLALAAASGFFARRPLRALVVAPGPGPRFELLLATGILALCAGAGVAEAAALADPGSLWPLAIAAPAGALFLCFDLRRDARAAAAEIAGAAAFSVLPAALAVLAGWPARPALALAAVMCARSVPTVLTVRCAVRIGKGQAAPAAVPVIASAAGFALLAGLSCEALAPWTVTVLGFALLARSAVLVSLKPQSLVPRRLGLAESVVGLAFVAGTALAYRLR